MLTSHAGSSVDHMTQTDTVGDGVDGQAVARLRRSIPLTQEALASRAGISQSYLSQIESGARSAVSTKCRERIAAALGCDMAEISAGRTLEVHTIAEAARRLRFHQQTVRNMCRRGDLEAIRVGAQWRIPVVSVDRIIAAASERAS